MSQFQILGRRPFPFKAAPIRCAYTNTDNEIAKQSAIFPERMLEKRTLRRNVSRGGGLTHTPTVFQARIDLRKTRRPPPRASGSGHDLIGAWARTEPWQDHSTPPSVLCLAVWPRCVFDTVFIARMSKTFFTDERATFHLKAKGHVRAPRDGPSWNP